MTGGPNPAVGAPIGRETAVLLLTLKGAGVIAGLDGRVEVANMEEVGRGGGGGSGIDARLSVVGIVVVAKDDDDIERGVGIGGRFIVDIPGR